MKDDCTELQGYLAERDVPCPGCGYNLRGLPEGTCPECRQELKLTVGLVESRIGALVACLGPLFAGAGAAGALLVVAVIMMWSRGGRMPRGHEAWIVLWLPLGCLVVCGLAAVLMSRRRGRMWFRNLSHEALLGVVVGSIALPLAWFGAFLGVLFSHG